MDNTFRQYKVGCNNVLGIDCDKNGNMLLATWGDGLQSLDLNTGVSHRVKMNGLAQINNIFSICQLADGETFCGSAGDGLYVADANGAWSKRILADDSLAKMPNKWVYKIIEKNEGYEIRGYLWSDKETSEDMAYGAFSECMWHTHRNKDCLGLFRKVKTLK
jgi:hypothetical protein